MFEVLLLRGNIENGRTNWYDWKLEVSYFADSKELAEYCISIDVYLGKQNVKTIKYKGTMSDYDYITIEVAKAIQAESINSLREIVKETVHMLTYHTEVVNRNC